jgi:hypothetical protein
MMTAENARFIEQRASAAAAIRTRLAVFEHDGESPAQAFRAARAAQYREDSESCSVSNTRLYVGNLAFHTTEDTLLASFSKYGEVSDVKLVIDRETGRSRGFAFVTMGTPEAAVKAIEEMNGQTLDGRPLRVNEAEARPPRAGGGGGGGGGGGSRGGYGGGGGGGGRGGGGYGGGGRSGGGGGGGGRGGRGGSSGGGDRGGRW